MKPLLYGQGKEKGITSIYAQKNGEVLIWSRKQGQVEVNKRFFKPFILIDKHLYSNSLNYCEIIKLSGELDYQYKIRILNYKLFEKSFIKHYNTIHLTNYDKIQYKMDGVKQFNNTEQYLLESGNTYFKGMKYCELKRFQFDLETTGLLRDDKAKIFMISMKSSCGYEKVIHGENEAALIIEFNKLLNLLDPDIIENHNIFGFDIPFLLSRAKHHNLEINFGRIKGEPFKYTDIIKYKGRNIEFDRYSVQGREIIDTMHSAMKFDSDTGKLQGKYGLKETSIVLDVARQNQDHYIDGSMIYETYRNDPERVIKYALWDVREVNSISTILNQSRFFLSQMIPMSYEKICTSGSSKIVELPLVRHYLNNNYSIPSPVDDNNLLKNSGGLCEIYQKGLVENIIKLDVKSMYPSIIIYNDIGPHNDPLNAFNTILKDLTNMRLDYKRRANSDRSLIPIQAALKIVINSSYGYLGYKYGLFNNPNGAAKVTKLGREIIIDIKRAIETCSGKAIEIDTDGVICKFPDQTETPTTFLNLVNQNFKSYPYIDIDLEYGNQIIEKMYLYGKKNYAYFQNDQLKVVGSALKNKADYQFTQSFIRESLRYILDGKTDKVQDLYNSTVKKLTNKSFNIEQLSKKMRIGMSLNEYLKNSKKKLPQYEVWIRKQAKEKPKGTLTNFYKSAGKERHKLSIDFNKDYDVDYYIKHLNQKFRLFDLAFQ